MYQTKTDLKCAVLRLNSLSLFLISIFQETLEDKT